MNSKEYAEGYEAYNNGDSDSDNPYCPITDRDRCIDWLKGYHDAWTEDLLS